MEKIRIQDDLYHYVNDEELEKLSIPDDRPFAGGFSKLALGVEDGMIADLNKFAKSGDYPNAHIQNALALYQSVKNVKKRNRQGIKPVLKTLKKIESLKDVKSLNRHLADFALEGLPLPIVLRVDEDMKDTSRHCLYLQGPSTILPDVTYYQEEMKDKKEALLGIWKTMAKGLLSYLSMEEKEVENVVEDALAFDALLAQYVKSSEEWSEYAEMYNPMTLNKVCRNLKPLKFKRMVTKLFKEAPQTIIVSEPRYLKNFKTIFNEENFPLYQHWALIQTLIHSASVLSEELRDLGGSYRRALSGIAKASSPEKFAYNLVSEYFSEPLGIYYGKTYFGEEAKKDIVSLVKEIIETYKHRIQENDFLSAPTKEKAILKLSTMKIKMGYPDQADPFYDELTVNPKDSLFKDVHELDKKKIAHDFGKLYQPTNHAEWVMAGHIVNACYNPFSNDITFPAAILQAPFYSLKQTRSQNLGGIGAVIGHEISHAFDNNGAKFDEFGNMKDWWSKEDFKQFAKRTKAMVKEFDGIELPWGKVNGNLVVSENIADNGGMACTLEIMSHDPKANYEEYFENWGRIWCMKARPEYSSMLLAVDVHSPVILRANMQPRNFDEWYQTFGVKSKDKMYLSPSKRVHIW